MREIPHPFSCETFDEVGTNGHGSIRAGMSSIITQAISVGDKGWASWTHPRAEESTASLGLPGTLIFLESGFVEDIFKPFLSTWPASLDS